MSPVAERARKVKRPGRPLTVYLPVELMQALDASVAASRPKTDKTAMTVYALEKLLIELGFYEASE